MASSDSYYANLVHNQKFTVVPTFTLESDIVLTQVPIAYSTWGTLNKNGDNVVVICHALTGSSDAFDWWRPLMGPGKALDYTRYFIFCGNVLGSPYGSASSLSTNPMTGKAFGPTFPDTSIRDDVRIHKLVLDSLGVQCVATVIGGSMGGMHTLEWPLCTPSGYVKNIIPIASSAYQGAWGISWGETQRQAIYADAVFNGGWYTPTPEGQPRSGLGTSRMIGMLTYRSFDSFEARFGRRVVTPVKQNLPVNALPTPPLSETVSVSSNAGETEISLPTCYSAHTYLHYQAEKFLNRFDANCYIHLTKKMDTHDVTRNRGGSSFPGQTPTPKILQSALRTIPQGTLVIGVQSDMLFPLQQQNEIAQCLSNASLATLQSQDGHDGFLLEFERLNQVIKEHLEKRCEWVYGGVAQVMGTNSEMNTTNSVFGEADNVK
ncbi:homoserine O-acetyltransferase [Phaeosphaeriaceae sp. PMI808]|nr:homoserine O-acetyltransferase [Phaeosphaeriaceae sp. PMI808]